MCQYQHSFKIHELNTMTKEYVCYHLFCNQFGTTMSIHFVYFLFWSFGIYKSIIFYPQFYMSKFVISFCNLLGTNSMSTNTKKFQFNRLLSYQIANLKRKIQCLFLLRWHIINKDCLQSLTNQLIFFCLQHTFISLFWSFGQNSTILTRIYARTSCS